jgi:hypothetical protein
MMYSCMSLFDRSLSAPYYQVPLPDRQHTCHDFYSSYRDCVQGSEKRWMSACAWSRIPSMYKHQKKTALDEGCCFRTMDMLSHLCTSLSPLPGSSCGHIGFCAFILMRIYVSDTRSILFGGPFHNDNIINVPGIPGRAVGIVPL